MLFQNHLHLKQQLTFVTHRRVAQTVNVKPQIIRQFVHAYLNMSVLHQIADLSVSEVLNVHKTRRVLIRNVLIHVQSHVALMQIVK